MISEILLKFGASENSDPLRLKCNRSITVFLGPNNSGKSQILREIASLCSGGNPEANVILNKIIFDSVKHDDEKEFIDNVKATPVLGQHHLPEHILCRAKNSDFWVSEKNYYSVTGKINESDSKDFSNFAQWYAKHNYLMLDGASRINLIAPQDRGNLTRPTSSFTKILLESAKRQRISKFLHESTNLHFALDITDGGLIQIRFGKSPPVDERNLNDETVTYMANAKPIADMSDGIKALTGILIQINAGFEKTILIDEPEAFLHPSLAFKLGKEISTTAIQENKAIFVSTHSPQFLMGAIASGVNINIVRMTYDGNVGSARLLENSQLRELMNDPLLRSTGVLEGLFHSGVVVTEANADRSFYQEINERLLAASDERHIPHSLFVIADNKQTIPRIVKPLRQLGISVAGIVDVDVLKEGGADWTNQLTAIGVPALELSSYGNRRKQISDLLTQAADSQKSEHTKKRDFKTCGGLRLLSNDELEAAENLLNDLKTYGLFIVPHGEVENWLEYADAPRSKHNWLKKIFELMGHDPHDSNYIRPQEGDVWDFLGKVSSWINNPNRRGIPN